MRVLLELNFSNGRIFFRNGWFLERALIETIKYGSKIFTEPDIKKKGEKGTPHMIYAHALDNIFCAMQDHRIFERLGFNLPQQSKKENKTRHVSDYQEWIFDHNKNDWYNTKTGECLTDMLLLLNWIIC